ICRERPQLKLHFKVSSSGNIVLEDEGELPRVLPLSAVFKERKALQGLQTKHLSDIPGWPMIAMPLQARRVEMPRWLAVPMPLRARRVLLRVLRLVLQRNALHMHAR
ncbi:hypothetical protein PF005_g14549, partial [Phytophthora fragariae]